MTKDRLLISRFMLLFLIAYISYAVPYTQVIPFLTKAGYSADQRGLLLSGMAIVAMVGQFLFGYLCDKFRTVQKFFYLTTVLFVIVTWAMYAYTGTSFYYHLLTVSFMGGLFRIVIGLLDTWTLEVDPILQINFGPIRAFGALGWAIGSPITAYVIEKFGYGSLGITYLITTLLTFAVSYGLEDAHKVARAESLKIKDIKLLLKSKQYILLVLILLFINIVATADMYTVVDKMLAVGASNTDISMKWSYQAMLELPLFFGGAFMLRRFGGKKLLIFSISMYFFRFLGYAWASTPFQVIAFSSFQMITFPLLTVATKVLVNDESPEHLRSTGQLFAMSMYAGLSILLAPVVCGYLVTWFGVDSTLRVLAFFVLVPLAMALWYNTMRPYSSEV